MASPVGLGDCIAIINLAITIWDKVKNAPKQIADVQHYMERLKTYMTSLQRTIDSSLVALGTEEVDELNDLLSKIKIDVKRIDSILRAVRDKQGPGGITLRSERVATSLFGLSGGPKELEVLTNNIDRKRVEIDQYINFLIISQISQPKTPAPERTQSKSPSRKERYNIIFIDRYNEGLSVVSRAYAQLLREWTVRSGGQWRIHKIQSAGLLVKAGSETAPLQQAMQMNMRQGGNPPSETALAALFNNQKYKVDDDGRFRYKDEIRQSAASQTSKGLTEDLFTTYDFILVFNKDDATKLAWLQAALKAKNDTKEKMGKLCYLGVYGDHDNLEIRDPPRSADGTYSEDSWRKVVRNIKTSFQGFLREEIGWIKPRPDVTGDWYSPMGMVTAN